MKKIVLVSALVLGIACHVCAQFGIRAGYQIASTFNNGNKVQGNIPGWYLGVMSEDRVGLGDFLKWHSGIEYVRVGHRQNDQNYRRLNYLAVPMGLKVTLIKSVFLKGGISPSFKVGEKYVVAGNNALDSSTKTSVFDLPMHLGAGIKVGFLDLEARYNHGLINVNSGNSNRYFQMGAAIRF